MTNANFDRALKRSSLVSTVMSLVVSILSTMTIGFGFYYNTQATLNAHEKDIKQIRIEVEATKTKVSDIEIFRGVSGAEMKNLEEKVDKVDEKLDRILDKMR